MGKVNKNVSFLMRCVKYDVSFSIFETVFNIVYNNNLLI